ncbi:MAG: hypothetical protein KF868_16275 [Acidobacteria bacterium]|nr:hypothetical protein [Acidobacteriota bacterium]
MQGSNKFTRALLSVAALMLLTSVGLAADPGLAYPAEAEVNDQKAGSILFFNVYSSSTSNPSVQNTRFNITNTSSTSAAFVHLFFVEGSTCSIADRYICLTANQTTTFLASEQDPGTTGYLVAVAVDGVLGCPVSFNYLIGDEYVKFETGHFANLGAEAFSALYQGILPGCDGNSITAPILFTGNAGAYNRVPRVLAISNIGSLGDGNTVRVWINRVGGSLLTGAGSIGAIFGILYDDTESAHSYTLPSSGCQRGATLSDTFPRTVPRFSVVIPAGQTGWTKFWAATDVGILGVSINNNPNQQTSSGAFNSGRNMHKLRLTSDAYTVPVFPPSC